MGSHNIIMSLCHARSSLPSSYQSGSMTLLGAQVKFTNTGTLQNKRYTCTYTQSIHPLQTTYARMRTIKKIIACDVFCFRLRLCSSRFCVTTTYFFVSGFGVSSLRQKELHERFIDVIISANTVLLCPILICWYVRERL